jgi:hypothetical protein
MLDTFTPIFQEFWDQYSELVTVIFISYVVINVLFVILINAGGCPDKRWDLPDDVRTRRYH